MQDFPNHTRAARRLNSAGLKYGILLFALCTGLSSFASTLPPGFAEIQIAPGLNPTAMALAPDGSLFLAQKDGRVLIVHPDGLLHDEPFLKLSVDDFNERGLEGIALHPNFDQEPWVYLYYTVPGAAHNRVSRVLANGDFAIPGSEQILLELDPLSGSIHNGGALVFGDDGNLYIGTGDGANPANAQSMSSLLGKILRISPTGAIPASNPFFTQVSGNLRAIYALGARNPFSMSHDPISGRLFFCDVGNGAWEEVNDIQAGKNYGWSLIEGPLNGQTPPANYKEPVYAYPHTEGCAIVGATFGFGPHPSIPAAFQGKFFCADYCKGWIKMIDPATGVVTGTFATGINRPVSLLTTPSGDFYYIARAGQGGGSPGDNTISNDGTLWKVFWIGDGAPLITGDPQSVLTPQGESARFTVHAFGNQPITYKWLKNGSLVPGNNLPELFLPQVELADSGSRFECIAINAFGSDTSAAAVLSVTSNKRPVPVIFSPLANVLYRCGDTLYFSGMASDFEEGPLSANRLSWRIDFHHADHTHPALSPVQGISEGAFYIPPVGETATDVFYRVYLTAVDTAGLVKTVWQDVFPALTSFSVNGPSGVPVNIDGQIRLLPTTTASVIGIQRNIQATQYYQSGDTIYYFRQWTDGQATPVISFEATELPKQWTLQYDTFILGNGTGLRGEYFFDPDATLEGVPVLVRLDTVVNFDWGDGSPAPDLLPVNYFTVRWAGSVQPVFSETYTFSVSSDDGCRLWVGDSLLIDKWVPQATMEHAGSITLQGGQKYPIRLEYLEIGGGANAQLYWKSARQPKEIIPKRQLYEPDTLHTAAVRGTAGIDVNLNGIWDAGETTLPGVTVSLFQASNDSLIAKQKTLANGRYSFGNLAATEYYMHLEPASTSAMLTPAENLDPDGNTPVFKLGSGQNSTLNVAWTISQTALYGTVWFDENYNESRDGNEPGLGNIGVLLYRADSVFISATATNPAGGFLFDLVDPGNYFLLFSKQLVSVPLKPGYGLNAQGRTGLFSMQAGLGREILVAFVPDDILGVETNEPAVSMLNLYPNPAQNHLWVLLQSAGSQPASFEIIDLAGRVVYRQEGNMMRGQNTVRFPVGDLVPGIYMLACHMPQGVWVKKWVKAP